MKGQRTTIFFLFILCFLGVMGVFPVSAKERGANNIASHIEKSQDGNYLVVVNLGKFNPDNVTLYLTQKDNATLLSLEDVIVFDEKRPNDLLLKISAKDFQKYRDVSGALEIVNRVGDGPLDFIKTRVTFAKARGGVQ